MTPCSPLRRDKFTKKSILFFSHTDVLCVCVSLSLFLSLLICYYALLLCPPIYPLLVSIPKVFSLTIFCFGISHVLFIPSKIKINSNDNKKIIDFGWMHDFQTLFCFWFYFVFLLSCLTILLVPILILSKSDTRLMVFCSPLSPFHRMPG